MKKSIMAVFMILLILCLNLPVHGSLPQGSSKSSRARILIDIVDGKEYSPELLFSKEVRDCLQALNFPSDRFFKVEALDGGFALRVSENVFLRVDTKGILTGITNWANDKALSGAHVIPTQDDIQCWEARIRMLFHLDASFELTTSREWDEDYYEFRFQKRDESGILSDYDSAKAYIAMADGTAASCGYFYTESVSRKVLISEASARERAEIFFRKTYGFMDCEADKGAAFSYHTPGRGSELEENQNDVRYCYLVTFGDGSWMVYVDAETGEVVAVDGWQSEKAASFGPTANNTSDLWGYDAVEDSYAGMYAIGYVKYAKYHNDTAGLKTSILNYMALGGNEYAMYIRCHANSNYIAGKNSANSVVWKIYPSDLSGNWHFVF